MCLYVCNFFKYFFPFSPSIKYYQLMMQVNVTMAPVFLSCFYFPTIYFVMFFLFLLPIFFRFDFTFLTRTVAFFSLVSVDETMTSNILKIGLPLPLLLVALCSVHKSMMVCFYRILNHTLITDIESKLVGCISYIDICPQFDFVYNNRSFSLY